MEKSLRQSLLRWYREQGRPLPFRVRDAEGRANPYWVWISEIMSQQSTMASVLPYFERWRQAFPTIEDLARASEADVLKAWAGLGYYSRARNVHRAAQALVKFRAEHGDWPRTPEAWLSLPGVGPYTAAAVSAIAFDAPVLPKDGNVTRVLARFHAIKDPLNDRAEARRIDEALVELQSSFRTGEHADAAQALMELGARLCRPGGLAICDECPLKKGCRAYAEGKVAEVPRPKRRPEIERQLGLGLLFRNPQRRAQVLVRRIPAGQRLEDQWELPLWLPETEGVSAETVDKIKEKWGVAVSPVRHTITRYLFEVHPLEAGLWTDDELPENHAWWTPGEAFAVGTLTTLTRKLARALQAL